MLKLEMEGAIRVAGWFADLEVPAEDGSWRADVMASSSGGAMRMAWEAQLSPITLEDIEARTDRYAEEGIRACWVYPEVRPPRWITRKLVVDVAAVGRRSGQARGDETAAGGRAAEREVRRREQEEAAARRREELAEQERAGGVAEDERRRLEQEEKHRVLMEQLKARWAEQDARLERERVEREALLAQERAEKEERERQALETARAGWGRLSSKQQTELLSAAAEYAWRASSLRLDIPEELKIWPQYAYGIPLFGRDRRRTL